MTDIPLRNFDSRIPLLRAELRGDTPMGSTYASPEALMTAMAEEIRELSKRVNQLELAVAQLIRMSQ